MTAAIAAATKAMPPSRENPATADGELSVMEIACGSMGVTGIVVEEGAGEGEVEGEVDELPDESWTVDHKVGELLGV